MCIGFRITMTREVLDATNDACILQTLQIVSHHCGSYFWVIAEGTRTYNNVLRIGIHIGNRRKINIKTVVLQIGADGVATLVGIIRVSTCLLTFLCLEFKPHNS